MYTFTYTCFNVYIYIYLFIYVVYYIRLVKILKEMLCKIKRVM